ncbi:iron ABC transporter ATP-binding protein [Vallitalea longa]|uniref:Iron ABC transporter ATP-binding protein n=1 Tax=Vallitalea longa TaxID=2936439 RepID=A0A9W5YBG3_9FIRM|nr:ABC transporter ATP-binding protein [Vallitalea longa]GKX30925.1 iron ABC transporter ATP-binding protein [Vallitalea longa]
MSVVSTKNLSFNYGQKSILNDLSINFDKGLFYSIIGPNGSGKTTLLKLLAGILPSDRKTVYLKNDDINVIKQKEIARRLSVVPQITDMQYEFSVHDIVMMGRTPYTSRFQKNTDKDKKLVNDAMRETGVSSLRDKKITQLSGGELQRVILARAIAQETDIMLLDEPISHLDIGYQYEISELVHKLCKKKGITVINIVHDLNIAMRYSDKILMLKDGYIYKYGDPEEVITKDTIKDVYSIDVELINHPIIKNKKVIIK